MDHGKLSQALISAELTALFQAASGSNLNWSSTAADEAKRKLKAILFQEQNGRCAYCRRMISDEPGHVEIDHILPKGAHGDAGLWHSNDTGCRRATSGYPQFTFVAHNLALTCKRCNNKKGTYDSRSDRSLPAGNVYIFDEKYYDWVHIYTHNYYDHIQIIDGLIYQIVNSSSGGEAVISVCKLDEIAAVEKSSAELKVKNATSVAIAIGLLLSQVELAGWQFVTDAVSAKFPNISSEEIEEEIEKYRSLFK